MSKVSKIKAALVTNGESLTPRQIAARYNVSNPYDAIYRLRLQGYPIHTEYTHNYKGEPITKYYHGKATREVIAAGYKALASGWV